MLRTAPAESKDVLKDLVKDISRVLDLIEYHDWRPRKASEDFKDWVLNPEADKENPYYKMFHGLPELQERLDDYMISHPGEFCMCM
jgi:hypothetical protein